MRNRVRELRQELGLTMVEFGRGIGICKAFQWRVESRRESYSWATAQRIERKHGAVMERLGITVADLMVPAFPRFLEVRRLQNLAQRRRARA